MPNGKISVFFARLLDMALAAKRLQIVPVPHRPFLGDRDDVVYFIAKVAAVLALEVIPLAYLERSLLPPATFAFHAIQGNSSVSSLAQNI